MAAFRALAVVLSAAAALAGPTQLVACTTPPRAILLTGTVVTPDAILDPGWVLVVGRRIARVSADRPSAHDAVTLDTDGIVLPGLVDLHNHVAWNAFPRWSPPTRFANRYEWRRDPAYRRAFSGPRRELLRHSLCDMSTYGEVRAIVGGATLIQTSPRTPCFHGLARNLDAADGFPRRESIEPVRHRHVLDIDDLSRGAARRISRSLGDGAAAALFVHLAEGQRADRSSRAEFGTLVRLGLLTSRTVIIHGTALGPDEFRAMARVGAALVWSPRSNIELYGETTDIAAALEHGVTVALAPDWAITGSSNMLDELRYAVRHIGASAAGALDPRRWLDMATRTPARISGVADQVGALRRGCLPIS